MVGKAAEEFPTLPHGQTALRDAIEQLKKDHTSLCMAFDNIWEPEQLNELLPDDLGSIFPSSSCILLTSRRRSVVDALECLCGRGFTVYKYEPELLSERASEDFFIKYASKILPLGEEHMDMVREIVPLCEGLPLTLQVLGSVFANESKREKKIWEEIKRGMDLEVPTFPIDNRVVSNAFDASYRHLRRSTQEAFTIIVASFYGWPWTTVQRIVGEAEMRELEDSSLLSAVVGSRLNVSRISFTEGMLLSSMIVKPSEFDEPPLFVAMHDLIMKLGKQDRLVVGSPDRLVVGSPQESEEYLRIPDDSVLSKVKILWLSNRVRQDLGNERLERISKLNSLLVLILDASDMQQPDECISRLLSCQALRYIHLSNIDSSTDSSTLNRAELSPELRELHVLNSDGVKEMPGLYTKLEVLFIYECPNFTRLSSNGTYDALRELCIFGSDMITTLPEKLGNLERLAIQKCDRLTHVPALSSLKKLETLYIRMCPRLETLPAACNEPHPLRHLFVWGSTSAARLASGDPTGEPLTLFSNLTSLVSVNLEFDEELSELPEAVGSLKALRELSLSCKNIKVLPTAIGGATSLQTLDLKWCRSLQKLPSSIGRATSLQKLDLKNCTGLLELPDEIGDLKKLEVLNLANCRSLQKLPSSIGRVTTLRSLDLSGCLKLSELPGSIADLKALTSLELWGCLGITKLPDGIELICKGFGQAKPRSWIRTFFEGCVF